ncbi:MULTISPECIES: O-antigen ligase family protein [Pseudoalteromonas]|uniref:O-antigen ligase family protein n=1 Tax=Pseudoalteromonas TaxID=53246 RepID=UPI00026CD446|nr:O-antigen ligase family protein [Pseudoalteromonas spongiae]ATC97638.1 hypothetical protein PSPO_a0418 [Pseudoalteromonas spongiae UST010723-006]
MIYFQQNDRLVKKWVTPYLPYLLILGPLFADILTGLFEIVLGLGLPFGAFTRFSLVAFGLFILFKSKQALTKLVLLIISFYLVLFLYWFASQNGIPISANLKPLLFLLLPFFVYLIFIEKEDSSTFDKVTHAVSLYGLIAASSIIVCYFLGIGYESYGEYTFGFKGVFISGNDIGICILLASAVAWYRAIISFKLIELFTCFICFISLVFIASRTSLLVGSLILMAGVFVFLFHSKSKSLLNLLIKIIISTVTVLVISAVVSLAIKYADDIAYHSARIIELLEGVSPRAHLELAAELAKESRSTLDFLFGQGYQYYYAVGEEHHLRVKLGYNKPYEKNVEKDFHDLLGLCGIVFTIFYSLIITYVWIKIAKNLINYKSLLTAITLLLVSFLILHAFIAGHVLLGSQVPIVMAAIVYLGLRAERVEGN